MRATAIAFPAENLVGWERAMYAFLVEKERRSDSLRTVEGVYGIVSDHAATFRAEFMEAVVIVLIGMEIVMHIWG